MTASPSLIFKAAHAAAKIATGAVSYRARFAAALKSAWAATKQAVKAAVSNFVFEAWGVDYTATVWSKVAGREILYIKRDGTDYAQASLDGAEVSRIKTPRFGGLYSSQPQKADFLAEFRAALAGVVLALSPALPVAPAATFRPETCRCNSCGSWFTQAQARRNGGSWGLAGGECGC